MICMFRVIHCYLMMYLRISEINVLKYMNLILLIFISTWIIMGSMFKKTEIELELLTDIEILLLVEKGIRRGICHAIHRYAKANNKYIIIMIKRFIIFDVFRCK